MLKRYTGYKRLLALAALSGGAAPVERTATGNPLTFETDLAKPLKSLIAKFLPVQDAGTPSPENILPITGWSGLNVWHGGKNLLNLEFEQGTISANNGIDAPNLTRVRTKGHITLSKGTYTVSAVGVNSVMVYAYNLDGTYNRAIGWKNTLPATITLNDCYLIRLAFRKSTNDEDITPADVSNMQIELGSSATSYEAPSVTVYPVTFPSTIYGGYVDLMTGEVWATYGEFVADGQDESWGSNEVGGKQRFSLQKSYLGDTKNSGKCFCDWLKESSSDVWGGWIGSTGNFLCYTPLGEFEDVDAWKEYLANHNLQIIFELASPVLLTTLTPQQINAIKGNNTVWSDANDSCEVTYMVSAAYAENHPVGGLGSGLLGFGSGNPDEPGEPDKPDEPVEPDQPADDQPEEP